MDFLFRDDYFVGPEIVQEYRTSINRDARASAKKITLPIFVNLLNKFILILISDYFLSLNLWSKVHKSLFRKRI